MEAFTSKAARIIAAAMGSLMLVMALFVAPAFAVDTTTQARTDVPKASATELVQTATPSVQLSQVAPVHIRFRYIVAGAIAFAAVGGVVVGAVRRIEDRIAE